MFIYKKKGNDSKYQIINIIININRAILFPANVLFCSFYK